MDVVWDGVTRTETLNKDAARLRHRLADAARDYNWPLVIELVSRHENLINTTRPSGRSRFSPLHQAAHGGATVEVAEWLIALGAWRTLQNASGERPVDVAAKRGHRHLLDILRPVYRHRVPLGILLKIQKHFHSVIRGRAEKMVREHQLRLPELEPLLESETPKMWFPVPGMAGGFSYHLEADGVDAKLVSESWAVWSWGPGSVT